MGSAGTEVIRMSTRRMLALVAIALCVIPLIGAALASAKEADFDFCPVGEQGGQCFTPRGVAINQSGAGGVPAGTVYVADFNNSRIQSFEPDGDFIRAWGFDVDKAPGTGFEICEVAANCQGGVEGGAAGQFNRIAGGIAVDPGSGDVYVFDRGNVRVQQFEAAGNFIRTWGGDVDSTGGTGFEVCEIAVNCQTGTAGSAAGMFETTFGLVGISTDAAGNVYVSDPGNRRLQKFDSEGGFLALGGTNVDDGGEAGYEVCTVAANCQAGADDDPFGFNSPEHLAATPGGVIYAADTDNHTVYRFSAGLVLDTGFDPTVLATGSPRAIGVNPGNGHLFLAKDADSTIYEIDPVSEEVVEETEGEVTSWFGGLAVNAANGELYGSPSGLFGTDNYIRVFDLGAVPGAVTSPNVFDLAGTTARLKGWVNPVGTTLTKCLFEYTEETSFDVEGFAGAEKAPCAESLAEIGTGTEPVAIHAHLSGLGLGTPYRFRFVAANVSEERKGRDEGFQTAGPRIAATWSEDVAFTEAALRADIDPEGAATTYHFDYGTSDAYGSLTPELAVGSNSVTNEVGFLLEGLQPGTTYHYRVVASNPDGVRIGPDHAFVTYRTPIPEAGCTNQFFRTGPAASLPDCRAYELVSPLDKGGGDIIAPRGGGLSREAAYRQASLDGVRVTYTSGTAFGDVARSSNANQYLSERSDGGWSTHGLNPPQGTTVRDPQESVNYDLGNNYLAFTPSLCQALLRDHNLVPLDPDAIAGLPNLYERDNCPSRTDAYEAVTRGDSPAFSDDPEELLNYATYSADLQHVVFGFGATLVSTPLAAAGTHQQLYDYNLTSGELRLVSVLPGGAAATEDVALGSAYQKNIHGRESPLGRAISADGSRIFWTAGENKLYVRIGGTSTLQISLEGSFVTAADDGSAVIYSQGDELWEFDVDKALAKETGATARIADRAGGVVGASDDLARLYFTSGEVEAAGAVEGELNLYLREDGQVRLVAVLASLDGSDSAGPQVDSSEPFSNASHVSADGRHLAFMSVRPLTGYDNIDEEAAGGVLSEVFRYDALTDQLSCVSCKPSGSRPAGMQLESLYGQEAQPTLRAAAWLPTREWANHAKRALSADGNRILFNAYDALVPRDTNGAQDVYQWQAAGTGGCAESDSSFSMVNDGCINLISTGQSPEESELLDASVSGDNIFFTTGSSIDPRDPGSVDLYDARVGGGFLPPTPQLPACVGDACSPAPPAPGAQTPASANYVGPGDPVVKPKRRCGKGKRKQRRRHKVRCVRKGTRRAANSHRRSGR